MSEQLRLFLRTHPSVSVTYADGVVCVDKYRFSMHPSGYYRLTADTPKHIVHDSEKMVIVETDAHKLLLMEGQLLLLHKPTNLTLPIAKEIQMACATENFVAYTTDTITITIMDKLTLTSRRRVGVEGGVGLLRAVVGDVVQVGDNLFIDLAVI